MDLELDIEADLNAQDDDGQVHFTILPGSVDKNRHLLGRAVHESARIFYRIDWHGAHPSRTNRDHGTA